MNAVQKYVAIAAVLTLVAAVGCGPRRPHTIPVEGVVTLDGEPVADAAVQFIPEAGGRPAQGQTNASGKFRLTTFEDGDGALPGKHHVTVQKNRTTGAAVDASGLESGPVVGAPALEWLVPEMYSQASTSGLSADVSAGMQALEFKLIK